jgi:hypothetical protein
MIVTKVCTLCKQILDLNHFYIRKDNGKHRNECNTCRSLKNKEWKRATGFDKQSYERRREKVLERAKKYRLENKEKVRLSAKTSRKKKRDSDPMYRLKCNLRRRCLLALHGHYKDNTTFELIGCTYEKLKNYLEKQFSDGMTWDNYGIKGWHVDHKKPCASFDLSDPKQQKECFHFSNLQPMWAKDNLLKRDRY